MDIQLPLFRPEPFVPLRYGAAHYVPILQNRVGELRALLKASPEVWDRMTPVIRVVGPKKRTGPLKGVTIREWVKKIHVAIRHQPIFLDTLRPVPTYPVSSPSGDVPLLTFLYEQARKRGLSFVPVLHLGTRYEAAQAKIIAEAVVKDGRGVAVHFPADLALPSGMTVKDFLAAALARVNSEVSGADLWVDFAYLDPDVEVSPKDVANLINELAGIGNWRSIVSSATTIPRMLGGFVDIGTVGSIERREWMLRCDLEASGVSRMPTFGDYAIQHPFPPEEDGGPGMRANIRYTVEDRVVIARGVDPVIQVGNVEYPVLCRQLCALSEFLSGYSWGDRVIEGCAQGLIEPGSQNLWRGVGTSHHMQFVTNQLSR